MDSDMPSIDSIFLAAAELPAEKRTTYLDEACGGDDALRERIERLLGAQSKVASFLESPAPELGPTVDQPILEKPGSQIGPYKLLQQIGEGGMGVVYMAEQTEPVERRVALKIIKPGMDTQQVIARFEAERQALAMMDHPNIAKVLDAGTTDTGRPYFVMELVKGIPITEYCDAEHLTPRERLELFVPICQAVQHAHQKGIIHRDLKPSNILIARYDDRPVPKIIDFGVAKATSQKLTEKTMFTQYGQLVGTIDYMSPEQAQFNQLDVDTRSDIYSLGVLLYELLTGETPFDRQRLRTAAFDELLRIIREEEPPRPSTRLTASETLPSVAANRKTEPKKLGTIIRGELDWIVMKALEKDRGRRYESAGAFAADVAHYLNDEGVIACPPSAGYKLRKFARRNRAALVTGSLVVIALIVVGISLVVGFRGRADALQAQLDYERAESGRIEERLKREQEGEARKKAEEERFNARLDVLTQQGLRLVTGESRELQKAIENFTEVLTHRPENVSLLLNRGGAYYRSNQLEEAQRDLEKALELQPEDNLAAHQLLAIINQRNGKPEAAQRHLQEVQQANPESVEALTVQAMALNSRQGLELLTKAITKERWDPDLFLYRGEMAVAVSLQEHPDAELVRQAIDDLENARSHYPRDPRVLRALVYFLTVHRSLVDRPDVNSLTENLLQDWISWGTGGAEPHAFLMVHYRKTGMLDKSIEIGRTAQQKYSNNWKLAGELIRSLIAAKEFEEAIGLCDQLLQRDPNHGYILSKRAECQFQLGNRELAHADLQKVLKTSSQEDWNRPTWSNVIRRCLELEEFEHAENLNRERLEIYRKKFGDQSTPVIQALHNLALFLERQNRLQEAEQYYTQSLNLSRQLQGDSHPYTVQLIEKLMHLVANKKMKPGVQAAPIILVDCYADRAFRKTVAKDFKGAAADFNQAIEYLPADPNAASPARRPYYWESMRSDEVYQELAKLRATDQDLPFERGLYLAGKGKYKEAMEAVSQGTVLNSQGRRLYHIAMLMILSESDAAYQKFCKETVEVRAGDESWEKNGYGYNMVAIALAAGPNSGLGAETLQRIGDDLWAQSGHKFFHACQAGACSMRARRYAEALERMNKALKQRGPGDLKGSMQFLLAITHHHLGNNEESRKWYDEGVQFLQKFPPSIPPERTSLSPYFWLLWAATYREATDVLGLEPDPKLLNPAQVETTNTELESNSNEKT